MEIDKQLSNNIDLSVPQSINTDAFSFAQPQGGLSESVQMADLASAMPTTEVELPSLSKSLIGMSVPYTPMPSFDFSIGGSGGGKDPFDIGNSMDNREQTAKYDINQDEVYTQFQTKWWEDFTGYGKVAKFENYIKGTDNEERLSNQQSSWEVLERGVSKGINTAGFMLANTVGMIGYGIPKAIQEKSLTALIDNDFSRVIDDMTTQNNHDNIIHKTQEYKNASALGQLGHGEWWADTALQGVGYLVGGLAVGGGTGALLKGVGLGAPMVGGASRAALGSLTGAAARGTLTGDFSAFAQKALVKEFKKAIAKDLASATVKSTASNLITLITSAAPESQMEALSFIKEDEEQFVQAFKETYDRPPGAEDIMQYREGVRPVANGVFAANLALVGSSNFLQFGDLLGADKMFKKGILDNLVNKTFGLGLKKSATGVSEKGLESATWEVLKRTRAQKAGYRLFTALETPVTEGLWEEGMQSVVQNTASDYMQSKYNPQSMEANRSVIESFGRGFLDTYGSKEGWQEILAGMVVGGAGSIRVGKGGVDFLGQRGASQTINEQTTNAERLNSTQGNFIEANERLLESQNTYNALKNKALQSLNSRIGNTNQQMTNSDMAKAEAAKGNLEQAQLYYTNAVFAKLMAEKRAGLSDSNMFDMGMMIDNIPEGTLQDMYGFQSQDEIDEFKETTKKTLETQKQAFDVAYDFADSLNLGATQSMNSENLKEASALQFFHGMMAADTANTIGQTISQTVGDSGVASAMHYYANLDNVNQGRAKQLQSNEDRIKELDLKRSILLNDFSLKTEKLAREPENEANVRALDRVSAEMASLDNQNQQLQDENNRLTEILNNKVNTPKLPFGNPANKFFSGINMNLADNDVNSAISTLKDLEKYINDLEDTTAKSQQQIEDDLNKAKVIKSLSGMYQNQMKLMRNFAKVGNMVSDPSYGNTLYKRTRRKRATEFDNENWEENDGAGYDVGKEIFNQKYNDLSDELKAMVDAGKISEFDLHTWKSNAEIMSMNGYVQGDFNISLDQLNAVVTRDEDGNLIYDTESELGQQFIAEVIDLLSKGNKLSKTQYQVYMMNQEAIDKAVEEVKTNIPASIASLVKDSRNAKTKEEIRLRRIADKKIEQIEQDFFANNSIADVRNSNTNNDSLTQKREEIRSKYNLIIESKPNGFHIQSRGKTIGMYDKLTDAEAALEERINVLLDNLISTPVDLGGGVTVPGITIDGNTYSVLNVSQRMITIVDINGVKVPFYLTTGLGGKNLKPSWYPMFGYSNSGWLNKTNGKDMEAFYERLIGKEASEALKVTAEKLNKEFGTTPNSIIQTGILTGEQTQDYVNSILDFSPAENQKIDPTVDAKVELLKLEDNIKSIGTKLDANPNLNINEPPVKENTTEQSSTETLDEVLERLEQQLQEEIDVVEREFQEAMYPTQDETREITTALDQINNVVEQIIVAVESQNKEINVEDIDKFGMESIPIKKEFARIETLLGKAELSPDETNELGSLLQRVNSYGLIEGRTGINNEERLRLSDLLEQRAQLENELFKGRKDLSLLSNEEFKMTFDSPTDDQNLPFKDGQKAGDAAVLNSYEFSTFTLVGKSDYQIANITPQGFVEEITINKDYSMSVVDMDGNVKDIDLLDPTWDSQLSPGDMVGINFSEIGENDVVSISFKVDNARRIILPIQDAEVISDHTLLNFESKNKIGSSAHYVLTRFNNGVEVYLGSNFNIELDSAATQKLNPGEPIYFEYDPEAEYNVALKEEYDATHPNPRSAEKMIAERVEEYIQEIEENNKLKEDPNQKKADITALNKQLFNEMRMLIPSMKADTVRSARKAVKDMLSDYDKQFDAKAGDEVKMKFKDNMVIIAKDKSGNRIGVVKSLHNSNVKGNGRTQMDYLRTSLFEQLLANNFSPKTRTKFSVPVQIVYMGIPNVEHENGNKKGYRFSNEPGDRNISPSKITSVGYVTFGGMEFADKKTINTPYNYAKSIMTNELYKGRRVPVVSFTHQGKEIIYPISLTEKDSVSLSEKFQEILDKEGSVSTSEFITSINDFLAENGIPKGIRVTSLNYSSALEMAKSSVENTLNIPTIDELMDPLTSRQVLEANGYIDINLNDKPFVGPKIRFDLNSVPEVKSKYINETVPNINPQSMEEIADEIDDNICE